MMSVRRSPRSLLARFGSAVLVGGVLVVVAPAANAAAADAATSAGPALVEVNILPQLAGMTAGSAAPNGLAAAPPMGFNDWNAYGCNINEDVIKQTADAFVSNG